MKSFIFLFAFIAVIPFMCHAENQISLPDEISFGQEIALEEYIVPGKINIFSFFSVYCSSCTYIKPDVQALHEGNPDVHIVRVNINRPEKEGIDWKSPVSLQFKLRSIPYFIVIEKDGSVKEGTSARLRFDNLVKALSSN